MAVPKKKTSRTKRNMRRAHDALSPLPLVRTATGVRLSHHVDPETGKYRSRQVIEPKNNSKD